MGQNRAARHRLDIRAKVKTEGWRGPNRADSDEAAKERPLGDHIDTPVVRGRRVDTGKVAPATTKFTNGNEKIPCEIT